MNRKIRKRLSVKIPLRSRYIKAIKRSRKINFDEMFLEDLERKSLEYGIIWDENMPMTEDHLRLMDGLEPLAVNDKKKVDDKKGIVKKKGTIKNTPLRPGGIKKLLNIRKIHRIHPDPKPERLRQTTIDEYFKPMRLNSANL